MVLVSIQWYRQGSFDIMEGKCGADSYNAALKYSIRWGESACKVRSGQLQRCSEVFDKVGGVGL